MHCEKTEDILEYAGLSYKLNCQNQQNIAFDEGRNEV